MTSASINLPFITAGCDRPEKHLDPHASRAKFNAHRRPRVEKTMGPVRSGALSDLASNGEINKSLMVGGSSRIARAGSRSG